MQTTVAAAGAAVEHVGGNGILSVEVVERAAGALACDDRRVQRPRRRRSPASGSVGVRANVSCLIKVATWLTQPRQVRLALSSRRCPAATWNAPRPNVLYVSQRHTYENHCLGRFLSSHPCAQPRRVVTPFTSDSGNTHFDARATAPADAMPPPPTVTADARLTHVGVPGG